MSVPPSVEIAVHDPSQVGHARRTAVHLAEDAGCDETIAGKIAIVVNELATNLVKHAGGGLLILRHVGSKDTSVLEILSIDRGPGMANPDLCLSDGYSTAGSSGTGLGAVCRLSNAWDLYSQPGSGTVLLSRIGPGSATSRVSGLSIAAPGETACGDAWLSLSDGQRHCVLVADGLGHGPIAAQAAQAAICAFVEHPRSGPAEVLRAAHEALRTTRGAAVAVAELNLFNRTLRYAGVGNIAAQIVAEGHSQNLVSLNGTLGVLSPKIREFDYKLPQDAIVIFHSDGLTSHVRIDSYRGLCSRDPAVIAGVLYRDFKRGRDDATAVVASLG